MEMFGHFLPEDNPKMELVQCQCQCIEYHLTSICLF